MIAKLISYFVRYPIWSNAAIVFFMVIGLVGFFGLKMSFFPESSDRTVVVEVAYPGASPEEMEEGVVLKVEEGIKGIEGIDEITSTSSENFAIVRVVWKEGYDGDRFLADVKNSVDRISSFPVDAEKPVVYTQKDLGSAMTIVMTGDLPLDDLKKLAEQVEDEFLATGFISQVNVSGYPDREISIEVAEDQLLRYGITFTEVANAVRTNNTDISGGSIKAVEEEILIRAEAKRYSAEGIGEIIVRTNPDGSRIYVRDVVSSIKEQFADSPQKTLFNDKPSVTIGIQKLISEDLVKITDFLKEYIDEWNTEHTQAEMVILNDQSEGLNQRIELLVRNGWQGLLLVLLALGFFLSFRLSFWVAFGIPFSFLGMFFVAYLVGITINMLSLFGMILSVGILVDDGIVVGENIFAHYERGKSPVRAAIDGAMEVLPSVFTSVTTTIIVFSIFFFLSGQISNFLGEVAVVMVATLAFSLIECTLVLPSHLAHQRKKKAKQSRFRKFSDNVINWLRDRAYGTVLHASIKYRGATLMIPLFILMATGGLMNGGFIQTTFFPFIEPDQTSMSLIMKPGTREQIVEMELKKMDEVVWEINAELAKEYGIDSIIENTQIQIGSANGESGGHTGTLSISLLDGDARPVSAGQIDQMLREKIQIPPTAEKFLVGGFRTFGKPVSISLTGNNLEILNSANEALQAELKQFTALKDVNDNQQVGKREVKIKLLPKAYSLGLTQNEIARQIRQGFFGEEVQRLQKGTDEVKVWVRYPESGRNSLGQLDEMRIKTATGASYPFSEVAEYDIERGIVTINHFNGAREIKVEADLADQDKAVGPIQEEIENEVLPRVLDAHPGVQAEFRGQAQRQAELFADAPVVVGVALFLMFLLLTLTFRSLPQALMLIPMIILGLVGALWGHGLHGIPVSLLSMYGLLAVSGIVINDAVVLMAKFNLNMKRGMGIIDAAYEAGLSRFRAILLTSVTTVAGLYPLILETSRQAQFLIPMAISVVYGVLFGTLFILIFFPTLIVFLNDIRIFWRWTYHSLWTGDLRWPTREQVEPAIREDIEEAHFVEEMEEAAREKAVQYAPRENGASANGNAVSSSQPENLDHETEQ